MGPVVLSAVSKHIRALWDYSVFVESAQILPLHPPAHRGRVDDSSFTSARISKEGERIFESWKSAWKKKWICEEIEIWLVKKTFWKSLQKQICPTLDGLKIKIWEHAFLLSYIFQNPIPNNFTG